MQLKAFELKVDDQKNEDQRKKARTNCSKTKSRSEKILKYQIEAEKYNFDSAKTNLKFGEASGCSYEAKMIFLIDFCTFL